MNIPSASSLQHIKTSRDQKKIETYNIVLTNCIQKILNTSKNTEQTYLIFEVPQILIGYPTYDKKSCIIFIIENLVNNGYKIDFIEPCYLFIDWGVSKPKNKTNNIGVREKIRKELAGQYPNTSFDIVYEDEIKPKRKKKAKK